MNRQRGFFGATVVAGLAFIVALGVMVAVFATKSGPAGGTTEDGAAALEPVSLDSRNSDRKAITIAELFGAETIASRSREYELLGTDSTQDCSSVADGDRLQAALESADCTDVARGTVRSADGQWALTIGVANLRDAAASRAVNSALADPKAGRFPIMNADDLNLQEKGRKVLVEHDTEGHYVLFLAITPVKKRTFADNDAGAIRALQDCQAYLGERLALHALTGGA